MIIGIDPDLIKSGVAIWHKDTKQLEMTTLSFVDTLKFIRLNAQVIKKVFVEAGWLNEKSSWHAADNMKVAASIGKKVGENHATGKLLIECIKAEGVEVVAVRPTTTKLNAVQFEKLTKYKGRTNQEVRDAAMLVWGM